MISPQKTIAATVLCGMFALAGTPRADENSTFPANSPYYEKDAWYDVSEWFDGNDYNPTDEAWWRWDDETYQASKDTSGDTDNDRDGWYGYTDRNDDDWYYDYYDPTPYHYYTYGDGGLYDYGYRYYDYDNDGLYDAYLSYADWNRDGLYDDYAYYSFTDKATDKQRQKAKEQAGKNSRRMEVTGKVEKVKQVQVRGGRKHTVVSVRNEGEQDKATMIDLGDSTALRSANPKSGDTLTASGPVARVGERDVLLAQTVSVNNMKLQTSRNSRSVTGSVTGTHKAKIRGAEHLIAMVETTQNDKNRKLAVDLGGADRLKMEIAKGDKLTFSGFPVKVQNKSLMMAERVQKGEQVAQVDRRPEKSDRQGGSGKGGDTKGGDTKNANQKGNDSGTKKQ